MRSFQLFTFKLKIVQQYFLIFDVSTKNFYLYVKVFCSKGKSKNSPLLHDEASHKIKEKPRSSHSLWLPAIPVYVLPNYTVFGYLLSPKSITTFSIQTLLRIKKYQEWQENIEISYGNNPIL